MKEVNVKITNNLLFSFAFPFTLPHKQSKKCVCATVEKSGRCN